MEKVIIKNKISGNSIYGRTMGKSIRESFLDKYKKGTKINIDFSGIETITHSFTDELIGIYFVLDGKKVLNQISFSNCNKEITKMIKFVINDRLSC